MIGCTPDSPPIRGVQEAEVALGIYTHTDARAHTHIHRPLSQCSERNDDHSTAKETNTKQERGEYIETTKKIPLTYCVIQTF